MKHYIACDSHKRYSVFAIQGADGHTGTFRVDHEPGAIRRFLSDFPPGTPVALEAVGHWFWIADEIEQAGFPVLLVHARRAKAMMGHLTKTDQLDAQGIATLMRAGTLPTVWLPPASVRDQRELCRTRMSLCAQRTGLKNRIHGVLARYALTLNGCSDCFGKKGRAQLETMVQKLPAETRSTLGAQLAVIDILSEQIAVLEQRIRQVVQATEAMTRLKTLPGVGDLLAMVIALEIGDISRFGRAEQLAAYSGLVPRVEGSGGRFHYGHMRKEANRYLKWAFSEAANVVSRFHRHEGWKHRHVVRLYRRLRSKKGHGKAVGAVARHLAEAAFHVLTQQTIYREPEQKQG